MFQSAVIQETLRLVSGVSYRLARSAPNEVLQVGKWSIPPNVRSLPTLLIPVSILRPI
jgi:cytochrome P450